MLNVYIEIVSVETLTVSQVDWRGKTVWILLISDQQLRPHKE